MELNGIANIAIILSMLEDGDTPVGPETLKEATDKIKQQLDFLERYMMACNSEDGPPFWHDVLANPKKYPTRKELQLDKTTFISFGDDLSGNAQVPD